MKEQLKKIMDYRAFIFDPSLMEIGKDLAFFTTSHGLPFEYMYDSIKDRHSKEEWVGIMYSYQTSLTEHSIASGITPKRLEEMQERNRKQLVSFIDTGYIE